MAEYSRIARGSFLSTGTNKVIKLPFTPDRISFTNYTLANTNATSQNIISGEWDVSMAQGTAVVQGYNATPALIYDVVPLNGISTFSAGLSLQYGPNQQIIGATAANPIVFNVANHGYSVGTIVEFVGLYQTSGTGMPQISGIPFVVSAVADANHFSVVWPGGGSNYTALTGSPAGAYVRQVLSYYLYEPGVTYIEAIAFGTTTTVTTTAPHNYVVGQEIAFRIPTSWGATQLNSLPDVLIPGSPIYYYVTSVTNSTTFVCNAVSTGFTAFNTNQTVASVSAGLTPPQVVAIGDVNSGGTPYSGGLLYPPPVFNGVNSINGPAISGAFVNNTSSGFVLGAGAGRVLTTANMVGASTNLIFWRAYLDDMSL
jgi:hypothetical protein